jgi:hypothetical protein
MRYCIAPWCHGCNVHLPYETNASYVSVFLNP